MAKDPAFLFYSKDWLEGTMEMTPEEKGVYIDLLAHQHQKGSLPSETKRLCKLVGLSEADFQKIWETLNHKFQPNANGRLYNQRLTGVVSERLEVGKKNKIIGTLGAVIRSSSAPAELKNLVKSTFRVGDFTDTPTERLTERLTEWFTERLVSLGNGNADAIGNAIGNRNDFGKSENLLNPAQRIFSIEHCQECAMRDDRWVKANKTSHDELAVFNSILEQTGTYEKDLLDYKRHFSNLKHKYPERFRQGARVFSIDELREMSKTATL